MENNASRGAANTMIQKLPGMKEKELRENMICTNCGKKVCENKLPFFWIIQLSNWVVDGNAVRRQDGLANLIGSSAIASAMGTDDDMAKRIGRWEATLCADCVSEPGAIVCLAALAEQSKDIDPPIE